MLLRWSRLLWAIGGEELTLKVGLYQTITALFDESLPSIFEGVAAILHAGDICALKVIDPLEKIAPVFAVEGNNDKFGKFPVKRIEELAGRRLWFVTFLESCISFV